MKKEVILIRFSSAERFSRFRAEMQSGRIFLSSPDSLPAGARVVLKLIIPVNQKIFLIEGVVAAGSGDSGKMEVRIQGEVSSVLSELDNAAAGKKTDQRSLPPDSPEEPSSPAGIEEPEGPLPSETPAAAGVFPDEGPKGYPADAAVEKAGSSMFSLESIRDIVSQEEMEAGPQEETQAPAQAVVKEKKLTPEERKKAEPVAQFIMNLAKAMARSGYYDPAHPGSQRAKLGLLEEFVTVAGECNELGVAVQRTREGSDIMITGILNEPVSAKALVGTRVAELFVPKLDDYFDRRELLSFTIKRDITPEHFDRFIDIMSDPRVDHKEFEKKGEYLTNALVEGGITEISTIFLDDIVSLETKLPWRVEMAINRLAKDLRIMPMFKGVSSEAVKKLKRQTMQDIIRPLNHPSYLNDFLTNCYLIAQTVQGIEPGEVEEIVLHTFPSEMLIATSQLTFKELEYLNKLKAENPDSPQIEQRLQGIKRILKLISGRVILEKVPGARQFLEQLYKQGILVFEDLPPEVRYMISTGNLAEDIKTHIEAYADRVVHLNSPEDALVYLKCFRRIVPVFIEQRDWELLFRISVLIKQASQLKPLHSPQVVETVKAQTQEQIKNYAYLMETGAEDLAFLLIAFVFMHVVDDLVPACGAVEEPQRQAFEGFIEGLGVLGVEVLSRVLFESKDKETRKTAFELLVAKGEPARKWVLRVLNDKNREWYIHRNAMMLLRKVSRNQMDFEAVRRFLGHADIRLRDEALNTAAELRPMDIEELLIKALFDNEAKIRWRAVKLLGMISPISEDAMNDILQRLSAPVPVDKAQASAHMKNLASLISALSAMPDIPDKIRVETEVLKALRGIVEREKGLMKLLKRVAVGSEEQEGILKNAIPLLGRIGGSASADYLKKLSRSQSRHFALIQEALSRIEQRRSKR